MSRSCRGQGDVADGTLRSLPALFLFYVSMILSPSAQNFYREVMQKSLHFSLSPPAVGRQVNSQIRAAFGKSHRWTRIISSIAVSISVCGHVILFYVL